MIRLFAIAAILVFVGVTLLLSELRWFRQRSLGSRVNPYLPGGGRRLSSEVLSFDSFGDLLRPAVELIGAVGARLFGVSEELPRRLRRVHSDLDSTGFRLRQLGWSVAATLVVIVLAIGAQMPGAFVVLALCITPLLTFLVVEQQLANASDRWKDRTFQELPVIAEQLAMLLGSGFSLGASLSRVADRGSGVIARDLTRVVARMQQGTSETVALREWAELVDVDAVGRLVSVLALNKEAGDLGGMVATEARTARAEAQRSLLESIEKRNQQVWIPVTVATLVPGVILMAVPFFDALREFGAG